MCNGKRWGRGTQYDRNEKTVFDGEWMNDDRLQSSVVFSTASQLLHNHIEELTFSANCCNEPDLKEVSFRCFTHLRSLTIRDNSFKHPKRVVFQHMNCLESVTVGRNCFKETEAGFDKLERAFVCSDNPSLKSIRVGCFSFPEFSQCIIHNLPRLEEIRFGEGSDHALCFYWSDCMLRDLPSLRSVSLGPYCFYSSLHTVFENLPLLTSIRLGRFALLGENHPSCDLTLRNLPSLRSLVGEDASFYFPRTLIAENLPNLTTVNLPEAFQHVRSRRCKSPLLLLPKTVDAKAFDSSCVLLSPVS
ncbi:hypothetical protein WA556_006753 [Blastocystis sp. ATCC 50177/Nand II]